MSDIGISCGSQTVFCDLPIRYDTYTGCSHDCAYCFARKGTDLKKIKGKNSTKQLKEFIKGKRTGETAWCDWDIPLHWGGMSDPFQPTESNNGASMESLKLFADSGYPFVVSTKGRLVASDPYVDVLKRCNAVVQISAACQLYDRIERGAPPFAERMKMAEKIAPHVRRVIIRIQPYMIEAHNEIMKSLDIMQQSGVYGIIVEGLKQTKAHSGLVKVGSDWCYRKDELEMRFRAIKEKAHSLGMAFFSGENRLRSMGDDLCCCGIAGLPGFKGTRFNLMHFLNGDISNPTEAMKKVGTAHFYKAIDQTSTGWKIVESYSFAEIMTSRNFFDSYASMILGLDDQPLGHSIEEILTFTRWLKSTGITREEVNQYTGTQMASHYLCTSPQGQCSVPTPKQFEKLMKCPKITSIPIHIANIVGNRSETSKTKAKKEAWQKLKRRYDTII